MRKSMSLYEPDDEKRDVVDDLQDASDTVKKANNLRKKGQDLFNKLNPSRPQTGNSPSAQAGSGNHGAGENNNGGAQQTPSNGMTPKGDSGQAPSGGAQAGGDIASNASPVGAPGGDAAAGASGSGAAASTAGQGAGGMAGTGGATGGAAAGGATAGGAAAAEAGGAAAGSAAAAGAAAAGGAAAGAAAAPVVGIGCLVILAIFAVIVLLCFLLYFITLPVNVLVYNANAVGEGVTSWAENVGQDLSIAKYDFMIDMYDLSSTVEDFAFHILHPGQAAATDEILAELDQKKLTLAEDEFAPEYTDTTNSIVITLDGAFRKGWARTAQTAEYRANQITSKSSLGGTTTVVDKYDDDELWSSDDYWADTSKWQKGDDYYIAGTFDEVDGQTYSGGCTDDKVTVVTQIVPDMDADGIPDTEDDDVSQPCYMDAIMKVIALQNCAEQGIILNNDTFGDIKQYGLDATYTDDALFGDDNASAEEKMKSTEYQLLRLAGEIAGRGIQRQDLNSAKEQESIYQIVTTTTIKESPTFHDVQIKYVSGSHEEPLLNAAGQPQYDYKGELITHTVDDYSWKHDHYEVCLTVIVETTYSVVLRADAKDLIAQEMSKSFSDEEKEAFYSSIDSYYDMQYELLCKLYNLEMNNGGGSISGGGGYQPGMTPEEIEELLKNLNLDPASARGQLVQIALASCGKYTYNQSNGFRQGVNSGLYSPGNVNYTGTEFDCSSFVQYCYFMAGIPFSPTSTHGYAGAIASGELITISASEVLPGDLQVVYPTNSYEGHVWMYVGNGNWCECTPIGGVRADNWSMQFMSSHTSYYVRSVFLQGG